MKKIYFFLFTLVFCYSLTAQYSDDFESYAVDSYIGQESATWTTWSGTLGGAEDAKVVDTKAKSGSNSLYFYSTGQGPQDVVLDFGQKFTSGTFNLSFSIYVTDGASSYWNFQQETTIGQVWAGNAYIANNGLITVDAGDKSHSTPFNSNEWNDVSYEIDLDNNEWMISVNGKCVGVLIAPAAVASLDIFPLTQDTPTSEFWIDDVSFSHDVGINEKELDVAIANAGVSGAAFVGSPASLRADVVNTGNTMITECTVVLESEGIELDKLILSDLALNTGESVNFEFEDAFSPLQGVMGFDFKLESVNGMDIDAVDCNNNTTLGIVGISKTANKAVLVEELTGTWCGYCPRGHVAMESMTDKYGENFIGVAVHGGGSDPMIVSGYPDHILTLPDVTGYPSAVVDRGSGLNPSNMEVSIVNQLQTSIPATFDIAATYDEDLNELVAIVEMTALEFIAATKRIGFILTEDHVTGTTANYNQTNYYANNALGAMGGYESLPDPVPAADMVYEHVARAILPDATGMKIDESLTAGEKKVFVFGLELPDGIEKENLHLIAYIALPNPSDAVENAFSISYEDAINNTIVNTKDIEVDFSFKVSPNPISDAGLVQISLERAAQVELRVYNSMGQQVKGKNYGILNGDQFIDFNTSNLTSGIYTVQLSVDGAISTQKVVISQ